MASRSSSRSRAGVSAHLIEHPAPFLACPVSVSPRRVRTRLSRRPPGLMRPDATCSANSCEPARICYRRPHPTVTSPVTCVNDLQ